MKIASLVLICLVGWLVCASPASAAWSDWVPFVNHDNAQPKVTRKTTAPGKSKAAAPGPITKVGHGTKKLLSDTKSMLTPGKKAVKPQKVTGSQGFHSSKPAAPPKPSGFAAMFHKEEPKQPQTVKDWMKQPRLDP